MISQVFPTLRAGRTGGGENSVLGLRWLAGLFCAILSKGDVVAGEHATLVAFLLALLLWCSDALMLCSGALRAQFELQTPRSVISGVGGLEPKGFTAHWWSRWALGDCHACSAKMRRLPVRIVRIRVS